MRVSYIIWSPQGSSPPSVTFTRRWLAQRESERLSLAHPDQVFHVCKVKSATVAGQTAFFGKWRPLAPGVRTAKKPKLRDVEGRHYPECNALCRPGKHNHYFIGNGSNGSVVVSEADLIDEPQGRFGGCVR